MYANAKTSEKLALLDNIAPISQSAGTVTSGWVSAANFERFLAVLKPAFSARRRLSTPSCSKRPTPAAQAPRTSPARQSRRSSRRPATESRSKSTCGPKSWTPTTRSVTSACRSPSAPLPA